MNQNSNQTTERWGIRYTGISSRGRIPAPCFYVCPFSRFNWFCI
mgnify:CR=1 FL=1